MPADIAPARLYDILHERRVNPKAGLPSVEEFDEATKALGGLQEFLTDPIADAVVMLHHAGEPLSITFEDIGRLIQWSDWVRSTAERIIEDAAKVAIVAHQAFAQASGYEGDDWIFDEDGYVSDHEGFDREKRRHGFGGRDAS
jgi:hypothetical protein